MEWKNSMNFYVMPRFVEYAWSSIIDVTGWGIFAIMRTSCFIILPIIGVLYK